GLGFVHLGFLAAGLAIAVPIVIHLLFRQKTRTLAIGSVRFLHQVVKEHRRRRRVRQWILLALRMLAVLLLALLFARPFRDESFRRGLEQETVLLVDRSASMSARDGGGKTAFELALTAARDELKRLDENAVVHMALCDAAGIEELASDKLGQATTSEAATDYQLALGWGADVLAASSRSSKRIVLISDFQRSGLRRSKLPAIPADVEVALADVGESLARNVAIESAEPGRAEIRTDAPGLVRVIVRNHGALTARQVKVRCELEGPDGRLEASRDVDLPGQAPVVIDLPLEIKTDGLYRGFVETAFDDALALDNRRWVAFEARHPDRVLLVDGDEGRSIFSSETYFLETALRLRTDEAGGQLRSFETERIVWEKGKGFPRLDGYRAVVLANVRRLSDDDGRRMEEYLNGGGRLLIFAGDQVTRQSLAPLASHNLLPGRLAAEPIDGRLRVDAWEAKHPALACFADPQQGDLRTLHFNRVLPLEPTAGTATILLQAGDRIIAAERHVGKGKCIYFGSTADRDWNDLPRTRMYVPLMRQILAYLTDQLAERPAVTNRLITKAGDKTGIAASEDGDGTLIVTNLDPRESALERVGPEELQEALGVAAKSAEDEARQAALALAIPPDALRSDELWTAVVWLLLIVLAAELLLAGRVHA
ncbi:MAG: BatA domain-containing protein, partial [Planctomycetia bacterium]|nr:BatA domain-containing protein [Planctomycetia bacterium]